MNIASCKLAFGITVYDEPVGQLAACLASLRKHCPSARVGVIGDKPLRDYHETCLQFNAAYLHDPNRLKQLEHGGAWWKRWLTFMQFTDADLLFKMDPDALMHRPFAGEVPAADVFGTLQGHGVRANVQGGIQGIRRSAADAILYSRLLDDPQMVNPATWITDVHDHAYVMRRRQISTDRILMYVCRRLNLTLGNWAEVDSMWKPDRPFREGVAVTHPHKPPSLVKEDRHAVAQAP